METLSIRSPTKFQLYCKRAYREFLARRWTGPWGNCYLGLTLGLILNCFVKHYSSKFLISEQEALCLILQPYYDCFLVPYYGILVLWCHLAVDHLFQSVAQWGELFLPQSKNFKCSDLISNFWTRQIKKTLIKWYILPFFKTF